MKKAVIIGIIIAVAIGLGIASSFSSMVSDNESQDEEIIPLEENADLEEPLAITEEETEVETEEPEVETEEPEETGRDITVELEESFGLKSP